MDEAGAREALDRIIKRSGESYSSVSRLIGRNPAYIQQYIRRGVPSHLEEPDIRRIARALNVAPDLIGGLPNQREPTGLLQAMPSAHEVAAIESLSPRVRSPGLSFHSSYARELASGRVEALARHSVEGDSMAPTLSPGDELLIDRDDSAARLRDGLYALRIDGELIVKRLAINPATRKVTILSDNEAYPVWVAEDLALLDIVGRVVWASRRFL